MKDKKITILYGGETSEREVSLRTGQAMYNALTAGGYQNVTLFDLNRANAHELATNRPDICLLALHGKYGEDGVVQGYLEMLGIAYTGSGVASSAVAFDKFLAKNCLEANGLPTAAYWLSTDINDDEDLEDLSFPCVVKPAREGSTVGISIVHTIEEYHKAIEEAEKYDDKVLVEEFIKGKELTVAIFDGTPLPAIWIKPDSGFYDYHSKYTKGATQYLFETELSEEDLLSVNVVALMAYNALDCEGVARVDIIFDGETPYVLEVNTIPGMTETSLVPKAAAQAGISFLEVLESSLREGFARA